MTDFDSSIPVRYDILDSRFAYATSGDSRMRRLWTGGRWTEGAAYFPAGKYLVWSDIPNDRMLRWDETTNTVGVFRQPAAHSNGNTVDREGRLVTCEQGNRRVTRTEHDGSTTVLAERYKGLRFNSPNDVVVKSDGSVWFTDPPYGCDRTYEGHGEPSEIGACYVYRIDPADGTVTVVADDFDRPNGLAFSLDERLLYVTDSGARQIRVLDVDGARLSGGKLFADPAYGGFDGLRLDETGRIWAAEGEGVSCYDPDGTLIGRIQVPEKVANVVFGGPKRSDLFICASTSVYSLRLSTSAPWATVSA